MLLGTLRRIVSVVGSGERMGVGLGLPDGVGVLDCGVDDGQGLGVREVVSFCRRGAPAVGEGAVNLVLGEGEGGAEEGEEGEERDVHVVYLSSGLTSGGEMDCLLTTYRRMERGT